MDYNRIANKKNAYISGIFVLFSLITYIYIRNNIAPISKKNVGDMLSTPTEKSTSHLLPFQSQYLYDFGDKFLGRNEKLTHKYILKNQSNSPVEIISVTNNKPCCGEVEFSPTTLLPDQTTEIVLTLKTGNDSASLSHSFNLSTSNKKIPNITFYTFAKILPRIRIEQIEQPNVNSKILHEDQLYTNKLLRVFSYGDSSKEPLNLKSIEYKINTPHASIKFAGNQTRKHLGGNITEHSIDLTISNNQITQHSQQIIIELRDQNAILYEYSFTFTVPKLIFSTPTALIIKKNASIAQRSIKIYAEIEDELLLSNISHGPLVRVTNQTHPDKYTWIIEVNTVAHDKKDIKSLNTDTIIINTNVEKQPIIKIPVLIID